MLQFWHLKSRTHMTRKCRQCGLVNWDSDWVCKRCGAALIQATPSAYTWFVVYCVLMALLYLAAAGIGIVFMFAEPDQDMSAEEAKVMGVVFLIVGLVFFVPFALGPFLPHKSWAWVFGLVLICLGLTSTCCLPVSIPLLIFWLKPEMKAFYGRGNVNPLGPPPPPQWN